MTLISKLKLKYWCLYTFTLYIFSVVNMAEGSAKIKELEDELEECQQNLNKVQFIVVIAELL